MNASGWFYGQSFCGPRLYICTARGSNGSSYTASYASFAHAEGFRREHESRGETVTIREVR